MNTNLVNTDRPYGYIYLVVNSVNDTYYIGRHQYPTTSPVNDIVNEEVIHQYNLSHDHCMFKIDPNYKGSGKALRNAIKKYGWDKFYVLDILDIAKSSEELDELEIKEIKHYKERGYKLYNIAEGGKFFSLKGEENPLHKTRSVRITNGSISKYIGIKDEIPEGWWVGLDDNTRKAKSEAVKGKNNPMYGRKQSEDSKEKNRQSHLGKKASDETKRKMSENRKNNPKFIPPSAKGRIYIHNEFQIKRILPEELGSYLQKGWMKGRK